MAKRLDYCKQTNYAHAGIGRWQAKKRANDIDYRPA